MKRASLYVLAIVLCSVAFGPIVTDTPILTDRIKRDSTALHFSPEVNVGDVNIIGDVNAANFYVTDDGKTGNLDNYWQFHDDVNYITSSLGTKVGFGTTTPGARTESRAADCGAPVTSGNVQTYGSLRLRGDETNVIDFGSYANPILAGWIQVGEAANLAINYNLALQPNGGNVGIGTADPNENLEISESLSDGEYGGLRISNSDWTATGRSMIDFFNSHPSANFSVARIFSEIGSNGTNSKLYFAVDDGSKGTLENRMVIDKDGNIGIGIDSPGRLLDVAFTAPVIRISDTDANSVTKTTGFLEFGFTTGGWDRSGWIGYGSSTNDVLTINNEDGSNIALIGANVGIGTTTDIDEKLVVVGNIRLTGNLIGPNDMNIGSVGTPGAITIEADGDIVIAEDLAVTGTINLLKIYGVGTDNIIIGDTDTLSSLTSGTNNFGMGPDVLTNCTVGGYHFAFGTSAMGQITGGYNCMAMGTGCLYGAGTTPSPNNCFGGGYWAGGHIHNATNCVFLGNEAGLGAGAGFDGEYLNAIGRRSLFSMTDASYITAIGRQAGYGITTAENCLLLGDYAGKYLTDEIGRFIVNHQDQINAATEITNSLIYGVFAADAADQTLRINALIYGDQGAQFGDIDANYVDIAQDTGQLTLVGDARVKQQIPIDNANLGKGATKANQVILGNYNAWEFGINDDSVFTFHLPHEWATGTDITVNIDWYINEAGGDEIKWEIAWSATPHDSSEPIDNPTHTGSSDTGDIIIPGTVKFFTTNSLTIGAASLSAGDQIGITLKRIAITGGTNPTNEPAVVDIHIEYVADKLGEPL